MNETEYNLRTENLRLKMALAETQSAILQRQHADAKAELEGLQAKWDEATKPAAPAAALP